MLKRAVQLFPKNQSFPKALATLPKSSPAPRVLNLNSKVRSTPVFLNQLAKFSSSASSNKASTSSSSSSPLQTLTAASLANYPITKVTTLPNGLRIATETGSLRGPLGTATVGVWIDTGSRFETEQNNGVAHFLEHLAFKGTARRTRVQLEQEVEDMGGHLNAYTSREQTVFYAKTFGKDVPKAIDLLSDILINSKHDTADIERERETIIREMQEVDSQLEEVVFDRLHETAFRGTPLARTILGPLSNIKSISRQQIKEYVSNFYTADRMVIAGAGDVNHDELVALVKSHFGNLPSAPAQPPVKLPGLFTGSDILVRSDDLEVAHLTVAYQTAGWNDPDNFPLMLIQTMLGAWDQSVQGGRHSTSYLVREVAGDNDLERPLAHSFSAFNTQYSDVGLFGVHAVCEPTNLFPISGRIMKAFTDLVFDVSEEQLNEAKTMLKMNMLAHLDGTTTVAEDIGRQLITYGRRIHPSESLARIEAVDTKAIKDCARRFFYDRDIAIAAVGPIHELPDYNWFRNRTFRLRY